MVFHHPLLEEWERELASRRRIIEAGIGSVWRHHIRVKILRFFISRYGHQTAVATSNVSSSSAHRGQQTFSATGTLRKVGSQPKSPEVIRALLCDIQRHVHSV